MVDSHVPAGSGDIRFLSVLVKRGFSRECTKRRRYKGAVHSLRANLSIATSGKIRVRMRVIMKVCSPKKKNPSYN